MAGANLVVRTSYMGANRLAQSILRPTVSDFIEVAGKGNSSEYTMEEIPISPNSDFANHRLMELNLPQRLDVIVIGIKRIDGEFSFNPSGQTALHAGDTILALGDTDRLDKLKKLAAAETESKAKSKSSTT